MREAKQMACRDEMASRDAEFHSVSKSNTWLVETRFISLVEQYYSTAGAKVTRKAKELFVRSGHRNCHSSRSSSGI